MTKITCKMKTIFKAEAIIAREHIDTFEQVGQATGHKS